MYSCAHVSIVSVYWNSQSNRWLFGVLFYARFSIVVLVRWSVKVTAPGTHTLGSVHIWNLLSCRITNKHCLDLKCSFSDLDFFFFELYEGLNLLFFMFFFSFWIQFLIIYLTQFIFIDFARFRKSIYGNFNGNSIAIVIFTLFAEHVGGLRL